MDKEFATLHIVYENCDVSIIPYDKIRFFFFDGVHRCVRLLNWNVLDKFEYQCNDIDSSEYFKNGTIILKREAGAIPTEFSKSHMTQVNTADRILGGDITQLHFYDDEGELIESLIVDYQDEDERLGAPNVNQEVQSYADGDIHISIKEPKQVQEIKVKYHSDASRPIEQAHCGEWCDLRTAADVSMKQGERNMISLGVSIKLPDGYEAIMAPRSSTFKTLGVLQTNGIGVIDETYCGEKDIWHFPALAMRDTDIPAGSRIAQFRVQPVQGKLNIEEVDEMETENRGGLGSTGV